MERPRLRTTPRPPRPRPDAPPIAQRLRAYRQAAGFSQSKLASKARLNHSYVSRLESGARRPSRDVIERIADVLGLETGARNDLLLAAGFGPAGEMITQLLSAMAGCREPARYALGEQLLVTACAIFKGEAA